jgi:hypothetical protein
MTGPRRLVEKRPHGSARGGEGVADRRSSGSCRSSHAEPAACLRRLLFAKPVTAWIMRHGALAKGHGAWVPERRFRFVGHPVHWPFRTQGGWMRPGWAQRVQSRWQSLAATFSNEQMVVDVAGLLTNSGSTRCEPGC